MTWKALVVEIIEILWDAGHQRHNLLLHHIHAKWLPFLIEWRRELTMKDVDRQIEEMFEESEIDPPIFSEEIDGETGLGGRMELRAPWLDEDDAD